MSSVPLADFAPDQPPDAVQAVALVEAHVSVELPPGLTPVGEADKVTVGTGVVPGGGFPPLPPASFPQPASKRTANPVQARPGVLSRMTRYTHARGRKGVGSCLRTAPARLV